MSESVWIVACLFLCVSISPTAVHGNKGFEEPGLARTVVQEQGDSHEIHCSRERSRAAWEIVEEYLMPFVEKEHYSISSRCRLHQDNDLYRDQEQHKIFMDANDWQCGYCKKSFNAERYLDQHFDERHYNLLNVSNGKCLADLCGALHCDLVIGSKSLKTKCNSAAAARNRRLCESLADACFPVNQGSSASRLHEFFLHQFCSAHSCTNAIAPFSRGRRKRTDLFYLSISILTMILLPFFYLFIYLYRKGLSTGTQDLKRISRAGGKKKSSKSL